MSKHKKLRGKFVGRVVYQKHRWIVENCYTCEHYDDPCLSEAIIDGSEANDCEKYKWNGKEGFGTRPDLPSIGKRVEE